MWDFLKIIFEQLSETSKWFLVGYFGTISLLILLFKNNLLNYSSSLGFIKKISYYIFLPIYIAIICWFLSATMIVEKDAKQMAEYSLSKVENSTLNLFLKEVASYSSQWMGEEIQTKEELVETYLKKNNYKLDSYSTQVLEWSLNNGLEYIKNKAIEKGTIKVGEESINFPLLIQDYLNEFDEINSAPFLHLKGLTFSTIHNYAKKLYWIYVFLLLVPILILGTDVFLKLKKNNRQELDVLKNTNKRLENNQKRIIEK